MIKYLSEIAKIDSGKSFRNKIDNDPNGNCLVIQMKDISYESQEFIGNPQIISQNEVRPEQLLQKGDILFLAKGNNNYAIEYNLNVLAVTVSLFFVIRPNHSVVDSQFLTWFLNASNAQAYFKENREGASVGNIRKEVIEKLEIELPDLNRQKQIAKLNQLLKEEKRITKKYIESKEAFINSSISKLLLS